MDVFLWVILGVLFAVAEIFTTTLFLIMFSAGAVAAATAAGLGAPVPLQAGVFVAVSALTIVAVRPALRRRLDRSGPVEVGGGLLPGTPALVVEHVTADRGMVKIDGEWWQARSLESSGDYRPGERVSVVDLDDGTAVVWRADAPGTTGDQL